MMEALVDIFNYPAHAICLSYDWRILAPDIAFNLGIALAYFCIPAALYRLINSMKTDFLPFRAVVWMFVIFIMACGLSHVARVLSTIYGGGFYLLDILVCGITFVASLTTAVILFRNGAQLLVLIKKLLIDDHNENA